MSVRRLARTWNAFAARDPLWSILTWDDKRGNKWDAEEFFATGRDEIDAVLRLAVECNADLRFGRALDFGCGVGRLTLALVGSFAEVHGVDVAEEMIAQARRFDRDHACRFHLNVAPDLSLFADGYFDFIYSSITLQHMPPSLMRDYLREFARVLQSGGLLVFQLPEAPRRVPNPSRALHGLGVLWSRALRRARRLWSRQPAMDMFGMSREAVRSLLEERGCEVLRIEPSTMAGEDWHSLL